MSNVVYTNFKKLLVDGSINFTSDTIKLALVSSSYTPDAINHIYFSDISHEVSGTGYVAGGATLANVSVSKDTVDNEAVIDADDVSWSNSSITARGAVVYKYTGTNSTSPLICYIDFGSNKSSSTGTFTVQWDSEGVINVT